MKQVYLVPHRCMGCEECVVSCEKAHDWTTRAFVEILDGYYPLPMRCNHCQDAPCLAACPVDAIHRSATGAVLVDQGKCIGCGTCSLVCPFGVPRVAAETGKIVKCDLCDARVTEGQNPICVDACPKGALQFGDRDEPLAGRRQRFAQHIKAALAS